MAERQAPVTDLAWGADAAEDLGTRAVRLPRPSGVFAYIIGAGTVPGAAAELPAAGLNPNLGGYRLGPGAAEIELHLMRWLAARFGLPDGAGGMVMTGGAMANFVGVKCARDDRLGPEVREAGVRGPPRRRLRHARPRSSRAASRH